MPDGCIVITAADARFFDLVRGCIESIREKPQGQQAALAFLDLGCTEAQLAWLRTKVDFIRQPEWEFAFPGRDRQPSYLRGLLARPFLRRYFPNFDVYLWIDADAWVQDWLAVDLFIEGATQRHGLAVVPEIDRGSQLQYGFLPEWWRRVGSWYADCFGKEAAEKLHSFPLLNAGVFAIHRAAPHWQSWQRTLAEALAKSCNLLTDQMALNLMVYGRGLFQHTEFLPAWCNWTCHIGLPRWDDSRQRLVEPYLPHTPIGILHLTSTKHTYCRLGTVDGKEVEAHLRYPAGPRRVPPEVPSTAVTSVLVSSLGVVDSSRTGAAAPAERDYISPGLESLFPDRFFPNMIVGDKAGCAWTYLRRGIPHRWYVDRRAPTVGFVSRDEAHILYNTALRFSGKPALEIGCWLGWSACHLALGGVSLDVIDPILAQSDFHGSVVNSLTAAGVAQSVNLVAGSSPSKVHELAEGRNDRWSLFFIDGNHEAPHPLEDTMACEPYAAEDALVLFHDLASPDVSQGLDYLRKMGWHTMVYQTMQIMGVAWRGNAEPIKHIPDPSVVWSLPEHLHQYPVSGDNRSGAPARTPTAKPLDPQELVRTASADDLTENDCVILKRVAPYTMTSVERQMALVRSVRHIVRHGIAGCLVECGVWRGGSSMAAALALIQEGDLSRDLYLFDTFEGMTRPTVEDKTTDGTLAQVHLDRDVRRTSHVWGVAGIDDVTRNMASTGYPHARVQFVEGPVEKTLPARNPTGPIALLRLDTDWYASTRHELVHLFPLLNEGGILIIDDYGHWEGARKAVDEFLAAHPRKFDMQRIDYTGRLIVKG